MVTIDEIIPDFSKLTADQTREVIARCRDGRTTKKEVSAFKRPIKEEKKVTKSLASSISKLSAEDKELLKQMFGK